MYIANTVLGRYTLKPLSLKCPVFGRRRYQRGFNELIRKRCIKYFNFFICLITFNFTSKTGTAKKKSIGLRLRLTLCASVTLYVCKLV